MRLPLRHTWYSTASLLASQLRLICLDDMGTTLKFVGVGGGAISGARASARGEVKGKVRIAMVTATRTTTTRGCRGRRTLVWRVACMSCTLEDCTLWAIVLLATRCVKKIRRISHEKQKRTGLMARSASRRIMLELHNYSILLPGSSRLARPSTKLSVRYWDLIWLSGGRPIRAEAVLHRSPLTCHVRCAFASYQLFIGSVCAWLPVERRSPRSASTPDNAL